MKTVIPMTPRSPFRVGHLIAGRYSVRGFLGAGSMGWVLKVADQALGGELVALKLLFPQHTLDATCLARFRQEIYTARQLTHPSIIHLHDFEENSEGETFVTMEYIRGTDLQDLLVERKGKGLPLDESVCILLRIASGLLYAHQQGVTHRDLKPANILLGQNGEVRICDFGLATSLSAEHGLTKTGEALGTPHYMAPEQFRGESTDQRADIYSFGVIAYELLTGSTPFHGEEFFTLADQHVNTPCPTLLAAGCRVPEWFEQLVARCCAKDRSERPLSFAEIVPILEGELPDAAKMDLTGLRPRARTWASYRTRRRIAIGASLLVALLLLRWWYEQREPRISFQIAILSSEYRVGFEFVLVRWLLGMQISLLHPDSVFAYLDACRDSNKCDGSELTALLRAESRTVGTGDRDHVWIPNRVDPDDPEKRTFFRRVVDSDLGDLMESFRGVLYTDSPYVPGTIEWTADGNTGLTYAITQQHRRMIDELLALQTPAINIPAKSGRYPLHLAVHFRDHVTLGTLLNLSVDTARRDPDGFPALHRAIELRDLESVRAFARAGADFDVRSLSGETPLMRAVRLEGVPTQTNAVLAYLIQGEAKRGGPALRTINAHDNLGRTALMHAAMLGHDVAYDMLIAAGADTSARDDKGMTAKDYWEERHRGPLP